MSTNFKLPIGLIPCFTCQRSLACTHKVIQLAYKADRDLMDAKLQSFRIYSENVHLNKYFCIVCGEVMNRISLDKPIQYGLDPNKSYNTLRNVFNQAFNFVDASVSVNQYVLFEDFVQSQHGNIRTHVKMFKNNPLYKEIRHQYIILFVAAYFHSMHGNQISFKLMPFLMKHKFKSDVLER